MDNCEREFSVVNVRRRVIGVCLVLGVSERETKLLSEPSNTSEFVAFSTLSL